MIGPAVTRKFKRETLSGTTVNCSRFLIGDGGQWERVWGTGVGFRYEMGIGFVCSGVFGICGEELGADGYGGFLRGVVSGCWR